VASNGKELLGERYDRDHLTNEEIEYLELTVVTEKGETVSPEELRDKIFRIADRDESSGYLVRNTETTGGGHDPLLPPSFHFVSAAGYLGVRPTGPTPTSGTSVV
jgi:hypothetical protein